MFVVVLAIVFVSAGEVFGSTPLLDCGPNAFINECASACPKTCENKDALVACTLQCQIGVCSCIENYVRDDKGNCIKESACPVKTIKCDPKTEQLNTCGNGCGIKQEAVCGRYRPPVQQPSPICPAVCTELCECKAGYARHSNGKCVPIRYCNF